MNARSIAAEFLGSFTYVTALFAAFLSAGHAGGGLIAIALAPGLAFTAMYYAVSSLSGGHFNPAVTLGLVAGGHFPSNRALAYIAAQLAGAVAAAALFNVIRFGAAGGEWQHLSAAANTFGSDQQHSLLSVMLIEWLTTALLVIVFMSVPAKGATNGTAALVIGLSITMLHMIALPVSNAALNPARATAAALFADTRSIAQLWVFWVAPILGAVTGGLIARWLNDE